MMMENCGITPVYDIQGNGNNDSNGWGDGGWVWIIFLFFLMAWGGGWNNGGWNNGGGAGVQGALTRGDLCMDMNFNDLQNGVRGISDSVNVGFADLNSTICHQQYDTAMLVNGVTAAVNGGFSALNSTICQQQYDTAAMLNQMNISNLQTANAQNVTTLQNANALQTQIANCCCENREGQLAIQNQIQQQTCQLENTMNGNTRAILDYLYQDKLSTLESENQTLRLAASQQAQTSEIVGQLLPVAKPAYLTCSPYASAYGYPYAYQNAGGCGCNTQCGCC